MGELVLECVIPYIKDGDDLNSISLVSKRYYDLDSLTRKHLSVHVHFAPDPIRVTHRFPNLESLALKSYRPARYPRTYKCSIPVTPWIQEVAVNFKCLKSLSIRYMVVSDSDLRLLAKTWGASLRSLEILGCKMFSERGLVDIARCCIDLRSLRLHHIGLRKRRHINGEWLHELALCNTVMESLEFNYPFISYDIEDLELLANKCSNSLVTLHICSRNLSDFTQVFKHAEKLDLFAHAIIDDEDEDYTGFRFPPNIRGLRILKTQRLFPILLPCLNQLRELLLECCDIMDNCQCYFFKRCPNLEVISFTQDICKDRGLKVIGKYCKKLRKLTYFHEVTQKGLIAVAQGCPNLEYLDVRILDNSIKALECVGTLKNLRDFRIGISKKGDKTEFPLDNGVRVMLRGCKKLEKLDLTLCPGALTDIGLGYLGAYGHNLRHVSLCNTGESDVGLVELLKGCPKLRKLKLNDCPFNEQAIASFVFCINQSLRYVWLDYGSPDVLVLTRPMVSAQVNSVSEASVLQEEANIMFYAKEGTPSFAAKPDQLKIAEETRQRGDTIGEKKKLTFADTIGERGGKSGEKKKLKFADMERM